MACWSSWKTFSCRSRSAVMSATVQREAAPARARARGRTETRYQPKPRSPAVGPRGGDIRTSSVWARASREACDRR